jgi:peptidyl-prolyl cis-trans isomerase D
MALIGKIRKNFWFVLILLGLALAAFVIMDMTSAAGRGGGAAPSVGEISGSSIDYGDFSRMLSVSSQNSPQNSNENNAQVWNYFVNKSLLTQESNKLGLTPSAVEMERLKFGPEYSPVIQEAYYNPQTGVFDIQSLNSVKQAIDQGQALSQSFVDFWNVTTDRVKTDRIQTKLNTLVSKAIYTPNWMAEEMAKMNSASATIKYVKIPFDVVGDEKVEVTDADYNNYLKDHSDTYKQTEETRILEYVSFDVIPTEMDSAKLRTDIAGRLMELKKTENDSIFAINNDGTSPNFYFKKSELPESSQEGIASLEVGDVYGPFVNQNAYSGVKLLDKRMVADSVKASVIFRSVTPDNVSGVAAAKTLLDSLQNLIETGAQSFDSLAIKFSQDGSAASGGDLGYRTQGTFPYDFNNILFLTGEIGKVYNITTELGVQLIKVVDRKFMDEDPKYKVSIINKAIIPSQSTQDSMLDVVNNYLSDNRDIESLTAAVGTGKLKRTAPLKKSAFNINGLGSDQSSRNIVRWAFDSETELGDVSADYFTYQDQDLYFYNKYVIVGLYKIIPEGMPSADDVKEDIAVLVKNYKKGEFLKNELAKASVEEAAAKYGQSPDTLSNVSMGSIFIPVIGNEPKVVSAAFKTGLNTSSGAIHGNSGVFVIEPLNRNEPGASANIGNFKSSETQKMRVKVPGQLLKTMVEGAKIEDNRFDLGY